MGIPTDARTRAPAGGAVNPTCAADEGSISARRTLAHCSSTTEVSVFDLHRTRHHPAQQWLEHAPGRRRGPSQHEDAAAASLPHQPPRGVTPCCATTRGIGLQRPAHCAEKGFYSRKVLFATKHLWAPPRKEKNQRKRAAHSGSNFRSNFRKRIDARTPTGNGKASETYTSYCRSDLVPTATHHERALLDLRTCGENTRLRAFYINGQWSAYPQVREQPAQWLAYKGCVMHRSPIMAAAPRARTPHSMCSAAVQPETDQR